MAFKVPRYSVCIPSKDCVFTTDVLVMDEKGFMQITNEGWFRYVNMDSYTKNYRGLSFWAAKNLIVTSEKADDGLYLVLIGLDGVIQS